MATSAPTASSIRSPALGPNSTRLPRRPRRKTTRSARSQNGPTSLRDSIERLAGEIRESVGIAHRRGARRRRPARRGRGSGQAGHRLAARRDRRGKRQACSDQREIAQQRERFAALLASVDEGVEDAQSKLAELASTLAQVEREATSLSKETGPALIASLVQVKEAAAHAAERAREAIAAAIPEAAGKLSEEAAGRSSA